MANRRREVQASRSGGRRGGGAPHGSGGRGVRRISRSQLSCAKRRAICLRVGERAGDATRLRGSTDPDSAEIRGEVLAIGVICWSPAPASRTPRDRKSVV